MLKKRNIKLTIMYDGSSYFGWQRLRKKGEERTIQGILEACLSDILKEEIAVIGSGRTDAGVHAIGQIANFHTMSETASETICLVKYLNEMLPDSIRIIQAKKIGQEFHSRYNALWKTYEYHIENGERPSVFVRKYAAHIEKKLSVEAMREAGSLCIGTHDFKGFASEMKDGRKTIKTLKELTVKKEGDHITFIMKGDGFLYNMARILAGTLVEVGLGKREKESILDIFSCGDRKRAGVTMESKGLFLKSVEY